MREQKRNKLTKFRGFGKHLNIGLLVLMLSLGVVACGDISSTPANTFTSAASQATQEATTATNIPTVTNAAPVIQTTSDTETTSIPATPAAPTTQTTDAVTTVATTDSQTTSSAPTLGATVVPVTIATIPPTKMPVPPLATKLPVLPTATRKPVPPTLSQTVAPASNQTGKLQGHIMAGPTCPVERLDSPCPNRPVVNNIVYVKDQQSGNILQTLTSDKNGYFGADLKPGNYTIEIAKVGIQSDRNGPHYITIVAGQTSNLEILVDTGMRQPV